MTFEVSATDMTALPGGCRPIIDPSDPRRIVPGHAVMADGSVWRQDKQSGKWHQLRPFPDKDGHVKVRLIDDGRVRVLGVGRLVLRAFVGPQPMGCEAFHFPDTNPANNDITNLRWANRGASKIGKRVKSPPPVAKGEDHHGSILTDRDIPIIRALYRDGVPIAEIAERFGVQGKTIWRVLAGESWTHISDPLGSVVIRRAAPSPENSPRAALDWDRVAQIRDARESGAPVAKLAEQFGVTGATIRNICMYRTWRAIT